MTYYRRYLETPYYATLVQDRWMLARAYEGLAILYDARGQRDSGKYFARKFAHLWRNADAELQPRVRAMQTLADKTLAQRSSVAISCMD